MSLAEEKDDGKKKTNNAHTHTIFPNKSSAKRVMTRIMKFTYRKISITFSLTLSQSLFLYRVHKNIRKLRANGTVIFKSASNFDVVHFEVYDAYFCRKIVWFYVCFLLVCLVWILREKGMHNLCAYELNYNFFFVSLRFFFFALAVEQPFTPSLWLEHRFTCSLHAKFCVRCVCAPRATMEIYLRSKFLERLKGAKEVDIHDKRVNIVQFMS